MKYLLMFSFILLMGMTPIYNVHDSLGKVDLEIKNITDNKQSRQFTVVNATPNITDLQDGEIVIYSSMNFTANVNLMLRVGATVYVSPMFPLINGK